MLQPQEELLLKKVSAFGRLEERDPLRLVLYFGKTRYDSST